MNDTERLDALGKYGLCIVAHDTLKDGQWTRVWACAYGDKVAVAPTMRDAIDLAVLDITSDGLTRQ